MKVLLKNLSRAIQQICYPSICIYCHKLCNSKRHIFCEECFDLINILEKEERCSCCFSASYEPYCLSCTHQTNIKQAYVSEQRGPLYALLEKILKGQHYRIPAVAALMAYQYIRLDFSLPDYIIPNLCKHKRLSILLAKEISKILQVPHRRFFLKKVRNSHVLLIGFQQDQSYDKSMQVVKKENPEILIGFTLIGSL
ncbi:hypothetical protein RHABOEDO_001501 [Candidatus Rhabdochlamydia oedothoracis]|uniref:Double zinc ribbon domain-containing protein n=1 Tax=Candidatus Rhabdochlamydia oedothoracis TaxID=2720720 RepID=A0ABX8V3Y5_9BACT|nr:MULTISPECIES: hypothetical protein [Rhabdochlamydia]KAG6558598.1 hypothetical protein RHOW815_001412 [Candidatus Rhabdochlamydia sp. W815]QYF49207.1 hypothetical protein RHABOEDO_001501 [Candidatus Rhabdochlamydia oedothoracis]